MATYPALRTAILREIFLVTHGSLLRSVLLKEIAEKLAIPQADADACALHLMQQGLLNYLRDDPAGNGKVTLTHNGIEEAERMTQSLIHRFPSEHPYWYGLIIAVGTLVLGKIIDVLYRAITL